MKRCNKCGETKPESEFYAYGGKGYTYCKECVLKRQRAYRKRSKDYKKRKKEKKVVATPVSNATEEQRFTAAVIVARAKAALKVARRRGLMPRGVDLIAAAMDDVKKYGAEISIV